MAHSDALPIVEDLIPNLAAEIIDEEEVMSLIGDTNAFGWGLDDYTNLKAWFKGYGKINFSVEIFLNGEQDLEKPFCGSSIMVSVEGEVSSIENNWQVISYKIINQPEVLDIEKEPPEE